MEDLEKDLFKIENYAHRARTGKHCTFTVSTCPHCYHEDATAQNHLPPI